jgi:hypothetical protein
LNEDDLLAQALGSLGGRRAGEYSRKMRKNVHEIELIVTMPPEAAAQRARQVLSEQGRLVDVSDADQSATTVVGILGAGIANLNPTVVTVTIRPGEWGSTLLIRGAAKEGLIKQRAGEAAAKRVADALA